jgi:hypothetical protein
MTTVHIGPGSYTRGTSRPVQSSQGGSSQPSNDDSGDASSNVSGQFIANETSTPNDSEQRVGPDSDGVGTDLDVIENETSGIKLDCDGDGSDTGSNELDSDGSDSDVGGIESDSLDPGPESIEFDSNGVEPSATVERPEIGSKSLHGNNRRTTVGDERTLQELFDGEHENMEDAANVCKALLPFLLKSLQEEPNSRLLREVTAFIKEGMDPGSESNWCGTVGMFHSIIHLLNGNEMLIREKYNNTIDEEDEDFLAQLNDCVT